MGMTKIEDWIGTSETDDSLDLTRIRASLSPKAGELLALLARSDIEPLFEERAAASREAAAAQKRFRRLSAVAVLAGAGAALSSGALLACTSGDGAALPATCAVGVSQAVLSIQVLSLFAATAATAVLAGGSLAERWSTARRGAEALRREIFTVLVDRARTAPPSTLRQVLEFFRRYQLELQIRYYTTSKTRHAIRAGRILWATAIIAGLSAVAGTLGGLEGPWRTASAFLGLLVPVLLAAANSWQTTHLDQEKSEAYGTARSKLAALQRQLDTVRAAADAGDAAAVADYVRQVHLAMESEGESWKAAADTAPTAT